MAPKAVTPSAISTNNGVVTVTGLAETVTISNFDSNDHLVINGLGGDDVDRGDWSDRHAARRQWRRR